MTLVSNVTRNKIGNFTTIIPRRFLDGDGWVVGLTEIRYTNSWYNLKKYNKLQIVDKFGRSYTSQNVYLPPGKYSDINDLVFLINKFVKETGDIDRVEATPKLIVNKNRHKVTVKKGFTKDKKVNLKLLLDTEISNMLGIQEYLPKTSHLDVILEQDDKIIPFSDIYTDNLSSEKDKEAKYTYDLTAGINNLMVYSDIVSHSVVGNMMAPLLRVVHVPHDAKFGENIRISYDKGTHYVPVRTREFHSIEIDIKDDSGETIDFMFGRVICTLHFVKNG